MKYPQETDEFSMYPPCSDKRLKTANLVAKKTTYPTNVSHDIPKGAMAEKGYPRWMTIRPNLA